MVRDEELMRAYAEQDDRGAFRELVLRYEGGLRALMRRAWLDGATCDDLTQQVFLQVHRARRDYDDRRPFRPWLFTIAKNVRRDYLRRVERRPPPRSLVGVDPAAPAETPASRRELRETLEHAIDRLPRGMQLVIRMHAFDGQPFPEVAARLGISTSAAKVRAHRAYRALRDLLQDLEPRGM